MFCLGHKSWEWWWSQSCVWSQLKRGYSGFVCQSESIGFPEQSFPWDSSHRRNLWRKKAEVDINGGDSTWTVLEAQLERRCKGQCVCMLSLTFSVCVWSRHRKINDASRNAWQLKNLLADRTVWEPQTRLACCPWRHFPNITPYSLVCPSFSEMIHTHASLPWDSWMFWRYVVLEEMLWIIVFLSPTARSSFPCHHAKTPFDSLRENMIFLPYSWLRRLDSHFPCE